MEENQESKSGNADIKSLTNVTLAFDSASYIEGIKNSIKNGEVNPLTAYTVVKRFEKVAKAITEDNEIKDLVLNEADKYLGGNTKSFKLHGATICKMPVYTWYDFSECGHMEYDELLKIKLQVESRLKQIEEELKLLILPDNKLTLGILSDNKTIVIDKMPFLNMVEHGEEITVKAPLKMQKIGLKYMKL